MSSRFQQVRFGEWLPDLPPLANPGALEARNVIPEARSYRPIRALVSSSNALTGGAALGFFWAQDMSNNINIFAGDASNLYRLVNAVWTVVSRAGGYTNVTNWEFVKFGERIIAFASGVEPQYFDMGVSALFANLPGSPPQAARAAIVRDFIVTGDNPSEPDRLRWSGFNASEIWPPNNVAAQADFQDLFGRGGRIQRIVPGDVGFIFLEHSIWRMDYRGPRIIFDIQEIEPNRGTPAPNSVAWTGQQIYFYSQDGFYLMGRGGQAQNIGSNRVNRWFESEANAENIASMRAAVDRRNRLVIWAFKAVAESPQNDRLLIYNWGADRWSYGQINTQLISDSLSQGFNLDTLDTILTQGIDIDSINVDSPDFQGGALSFIAFNASSELASFSGAALDGIVDTKEVSDPTGQRLFCRAVRPLVDGASPTVTVQTGTRNIQDGGSATFGAAQSLNAIGEANFRENARYFRFRVNTSGDYDFAQGCEVALRPAGRR